MILILTLFLLQVLLFEYLVILINTLYSSTYIFRRYVNANSTDMFGIKVAHNELILCDNLLIFYILIININCKKYPYFSPVYYENHSSINDIRPLKIPSSSRKPIGQQISHKNIRHSFLTHARKTKRSFITLARINWT